MRNIFHEFQFWPDGTADHHFCSVAIDRILFKLVSYKDMHKILDEFYFGQIRSLTAELAALACLKSIT